MSKKKEIIEDKIEEIIEEKKEKKESLKDQLTEISIEFINRNNQKEIKKFNIMVKSKKDIIIKPISSNCINIFIKKGKDELYQDRFFTNDIKSFKLL